MKKAIHIRTKLVTTDYLDGRLDELKRENNIKLDKIVKRIDDVNNQFVTTNQKIEGVVIYMNARFDEVNLSLDRIERLISTMFKDYQVRIVQLEENHKNIMRKNARETM